MLIILGLQYGGNVYKKNKAGQIPLDFCKPNTENHIREIINLAKANFE